MNVYNRAGFPSSAPVSFNIEHSRTEQTRYAVAGLIHAVQEKNRLMANHVGPIYSFAAANILLAAMSTGIQTLCTENANPGTVDDFDLDSAFIATTNAVCVGLAYFSLALYRMYDNKDRMEAISSEIAAFSDEISACDSHEFVEITRELMGKGVFDDYMESVNERNNLSKVGDALLALEPVELVRQLSGSRKPELALTAVFLANNAPIESMPAALENYLLENPDVALLTKNRFIELADVQPSVREVRSFFLEEGQVSGRISGISRRILEIAENHERRSANVVQRPLDLEAHGLLHGDLEMADLARRQ